MLVTIDFETFYDDDYTLKKLSTSEYIRHPKFEALCCAIKVGDSKTMVYWGREAIQQALWSIDWREAEMLAHHAHFEGLVLSHHFSVRPKAYRDTLSMARGTFPKGMSNSLEAVTERLGVANKFKMPDFKGKHAADFTPELEREVSLYVGRDVDSCREVYDRLLEAYPPEELELIDITVRMFADPVLHLDVARAEAELARERASKADQIGASGASLDVLLSQKLFTAELAKIGVPVPTKVSKDTGKIIPALAKTDPVFMAMKSHPDPRVAALVRGRLAAKSTIGETRAKRLLYAGSRGWCLPVYLNYCGAHTTRWSGGDGLNFQNLPRGGELRLSLMAPPGHVLVVTDSAQIEVRVLAWLAKETWLLDAFREKTDPYCLFGTVAYGRTITKADKLERQASKICVLGLGYGMGALKLRLQMLKDGLDLDLSVCERFVQTYRRTNRNVVALWKTMERVIADMALGRDGEYRGVTWERDKVVLPNGMALNYPGTDAVVEESPPNPMMPHAEPRIMVMDGSYEGAGGRSKLYGGLMTENWVQALARVIVAEQMRQIARTQRVVMMSHDETVTCVPKAEADEALANNLRIMRTAPAWAPDLPLDAEGGYDVRYSK